ncbi:MAG: ABC transporter substrate-binding protein, partial [Janthinobacterium lividum]
MSQSLRKSAIILLACVTGVVLGSSNTTTAEPQPKHGGTLVFAVDAEPPNYDCHANVSFAALHPLAPHYSTLLKFDTANYPQIIGDLAESWVVSPDRRTYTFKLRPNVLFHDGTRFSAIDVKASYERIARPPAGVVSARQVDYAAIEEIDTPDPLTVIFHLQWPDAAMLSNFASPWNCIYSGSKLKDDPQYPRNHVMGTGPFVFVAYDKGQRWVGKRWEHYFIPGKPYLEGYEADFMNGHPVVEALEHGRIMAEFRSVTPVEQSELTDNMGDRVSIYESPWINNLLLVFNNKQPPFDDPRVRRALSLAIDRWGLAESLAPTTFLKFVGGLMRPGASMSTPEIDLIKLPGFSHDIVAAREEARRLLKEAGLHDLTITLTNRDVPMPYAAGADAVIAAWKTIGVMVTQQNLDTTTWQTTLESGHFSVAFDFVSDFIDDPTLQLRKFVSRDLSPVN